MPLQRAPGLPRTERIEFPMADQLLMTPVEASITLGALRKLDNNPHGSPADLVGVFHFKRATIEAIASAKYEATQAAPDIDVDDV
jgi:Protein of unknown function (DUF1488)